MQLSLIHTGFSSKPAARFSLPVASVASPAASLCSGVLLVPLMAILAMCAGLSRFGTSFCASGKPFVENVPNASIHHSGVVHALFSASLNRVWFHAANFHKFGKKMLFAFYGHINRVSAVLHVLFVANPSAVGRFIISVIVNPVKFATVRAHPHVGNKLPKIIIPLRANGYSTSAVIREWFRFWIVAPLSHIRPRAIKGVFRFKHTEILSLIDFGSVLQRERKVNVF